MELLLTALRRIATNLVSDALEEKTVGRFANAARQLDIQISELVKESSGFDSVISLTPAIGESYPLFQSLPEHATLQLLDAIEDESRGILRHSGIRNYLKALPPGITNQKYSLHSNGNMLREVEFGEINLPEIPAELPFLIRCTGKIIGVGFEPGKGEVRVKTGNNCTLTFSANDKQVDSALDLRYSEIRAVGVVQGATHRLLILQASHLPIFHSTRETAVFDRWDGVLRRLAQ